MSAETPRRRTMLLVAWAVGLLVVGALAACAPTTQASLPNTPAAQETQTVAQVAFHRMEIGRLQTGAYTTNVLVDLQLPRGVRWTVLEFTDRDYLLRFNHDEVTTLEWLVDPSGVRVLDAS